MVRSDVVVDELYFGACLCYALHQRCATQTVDRTRETRLSDHPTAIRNDAGQRGKLLPGQSVLDSLYPRFTAKSC